MGSHPPEAGKSTLDIAAKRRKIHKKSKLHIVGSGLWGYRKSARYAAVFSFFHFEATLRTLLNSLTYSIIQQLPLIQRLQTSFHPGDMALKCSWLGDLQILYSKNVIHVNNAYDKIDNSEQEQDLGRQTTPVNLCPATQ